MLCSVLALSLVASVHAQNARRLDNLERPPLSTLSSNSTTAQIDFRQGVYQDGTSGVIDAPVHYEVKNLNAALTLQLTNLVPGVQRDIYITTDGTARVVSIVTNGITSATRVNWPLSIGVTNGSYGVSITNRARITLLVRPVGEVEVRWAWYQ